MFLPRESFSPLGGFIDNLCPFFFVTTWLPSFFLGMEKLDLLGCGSPGHNVRSRLQRAKRQALFFLRSKSVPPPSQGLQTDAFFPRFSAESMVLRTTSSSLVLGSTPVFLRPYSFFPARIALRSSDIDFGSNSYTLDVWKVNSS